MQYNEKSPLLHTKLTNIPLTQTPLGVGLRDKYTTFFRSEQRSINKIEIWMRKEQTFRYFPAKTKKCSVLIHRALDQWWEEKRISWDGNLNIFHKYTNRLSFWALAYSPLFNDTGIVTTVLLIREIITYHLRTVLVIVDDISRIAAGGVYWLFLLIYAYLF